MWPIRILTLLFVLSACGPAAPPVTDAGAPDEGASDAGVPDAGSTPLRALFRSGALTAAQRARVSPAGLRVQRWRDRVLVLSLTRDETGRTSRRLSASVNGAEVWAVEETGAERLHDFAVHPSGEITLGLERRDVTSDAYELLRLGLDGQIRHRQVLARPQTIPVSDRPSALLMTGAKDGSVVSGTLPWLELEADGEHVVAGVVSWVEGSGDAVASALLALRWDGRFTERWARSVDGAHSLIAIAWQYDEFLWLDAATRLLVRVDERGGVVVGRTLSSGACMALADTFRELTPVRCRELRSINSPHRYQPFAVTRFSATGERLGTFVVAPGRLDEFVVFDLAVRGDEVAVAGTAVRLGPDDAPVPYFEPPGSTSGTALSPYDGYLAVAGSDGAVRFERFVDEGRGELFSALRWTDEGLLAVGAAGWNRWTGGMSVSRGAHPWLVLAPLDAAHPLVRTLPNESLERHTYPLDVDVSAADVLAVGPADAPMTHSGDTSIAPMAMGGLQLRLTLAP